MISSSTTPVLRTLLRTQPALSSRTYYYAANLCIQRPRGLQNQRANISMGSFFSRMFSLGGGGGKGKNRVYNSARNPGELESLILQSTSSRKPLITFWTASYCPTCKVVEPLLNRLITSGVGESTSGSPAAPGEANGVMYVEVEFDSPDMMMSDLGLRYMITALPTLMTFDRGEVVTESRTTDANKMKNEKWLTEWIEKEARRRGEGNSGSGGGFFGGLFGNTRN